MFNQRQFPPIDNNLPARPFPNRPFNQVNPVDYQTQIDQLRQMISELQTRVSTLENA